MFLSLFEQFDTFPELYGTCGELYDVEDLKPLDVPHLLGKLAFLHRDVPMNCKIPEIMGRARDKGRKPVKNRKWKDRIKMESGREYNIRKGESGENGTGT